MATLELGVFAMTHTTRRTLLHAGIALVAMHVVFAAIFAGAYFAYMRPGPEVARYFGDLEDVSGTLCGPRRSR